MLINWHESTVWHYCQVEVTTTRIFLQVDKGELYEIYLEYNLLIIVWMMIAAKRKEICLDTIINFWFKLYYQISATNKVVSIISDSIYLGALWLNTDCHAHNCTAVCKKSIKRFFLNNQTNPIFYSKWSETDVCVYYVRFSLGEITFVFGFFSRIEQNRTIAHLQSNDD